MKYLFLLFLTVILLPTSAQQNRNEPPDDSAYVLIADNGKRFRMYVPGRTLKIHYWQAGIVQKAKGRLLVNFPDSLTLVPFRKKSVITTFSIDSVVSIIPWHRKGKIAMAWVAGGGLVAYGLAELASRPLKMNGSANNGLAVLILTGTAVVALYYVAIALPATLMGEWLFIRSAKKGYHFFIKKLPFENSVWGKILPREFPATKPVYSR